MTKYTHAGAAVYQQKEGKIVFLVISSSDGTSWVLPKGHIEMHELPEETALRELREETGITGEIICELSEQHFKANDETIKVKYFLIKKTDSIEAQESRSLRWLEAEKAIDTLVFKEAREVLKKAVEFLSQMN
jgi:8-oxo-dGTP diphosphatase